jgi:chain length determinant protein tyrosine kinase EpsG
MEKMMNQISSPLAIVPSRKRDACIGSVLQKMGKITPLDTERIVKLQNERGLRFGEAARMLGLISDLDLEQVLAYQFDYAYLQVGQGGLSPDLVAAYQPFSEQVETLRAIRSQLMQHWFARSRKTLVIASVLPDDEASMLVANLAVAFSQLGERTLLVDANLRAPRQAHIFNLRGSKGLSDILAERADMKAVTQIEPFADLSILQAGTMPPNPQELLSRTSFAAFNSEAGQLFDIVLYDVSAFSTGADAFAVAARAGGVLLLARKDQTRLSDIARASAQLRRHAVEVVGSVMLDL